MCFAQLQWNIPSTRSLIWSLHQPTGRALYSTLLSYCVGRLWSVRPPDRLHSYITYLQCFYLITRSSLWLHWIGFQELMVRNKDLKYALSLRSMGNFCGFLNNIVLCAGWAWFVFCLGSVIFESIVFEWRMCLWALLIQLIRWACVLSMPTWHPQRRWGVDNKALYQVCARTPLHA